MSNNNKKLSLLDDSDKGLIINAEKIKCDESVGYKDDKTYINIYHNKKTCLICSWKKLCLTSTLTMCLLILTLLLVLFFHSAPSFAQSTLNNTSMDIIGGTLYNPTNSSISLNATIIVSNAGFLAAALKATTYTVTSDGFTIGTMSMPSIITKANKNTMLTISSELQITNKTQFQQSCKQLLQNVDQKWRLSANKVTLTVDTKIIGKKDYSVDVNKELTLKGTNVYNFIASDLNVASATNSAITSVTNLQFISDSIFTFVLPQILMSIYYDDIYIGYAKMSSSFSMKPGLNLLSNQSLIMESESYNQESLNKFCSNYISGKDQKIRMRGPIAANSVIDEVFDEIVMALGSTQNMLVFGGLVTRESEQGWKVGSTKKHVRGAYTDVLNPLNVPIKIINTSAVTYLQEPIKYHVTLVKFAKEYDCETAEFAQLNIGAGMYKDNATKTWIDVAPNGRTTFFNIASPPKGSKPGKCMDLYDFSCCFATLNTAYACKLNPGIQEKASDGELSTDYMPLELHLNMTMLIDNKFEMNVTYKQPFLPLYFGYEVYDGYAKDLFLSCKSFIFE